MEEQTLVLIKPDGLKKSLTGNILTRWSGCAIAIDIGWAFIRKKEEGFYVDFNS